MDSDTSIKVLFGNAANGSDTKDIRELNDVEADLLIERIKAFQPKAFARHIKNHKPSFEFDFQFKSMELSVPNLNELQINQSIPLPLEESGLWDGTINFHIRQECLRLWAFLNDGCNEMKFVKGPPGVGKSIEDVATDIVQWTNIIKVSGPDETHSESIERWMYSLIESNSVDLVVVDGAFTELFFRHVCNAQHFNPHISFIICSSYQAVVMKGVYTSNFPHTMFEMCSWTFEEYQCAVESNALRGGADLNERYYYAGGSIRFMNKDTAALKPLMDELIARVADFSSLLSGAVGLASANAINTLMAVFQQGSRTISTPLSEYVIRVLSEKVSMGNIKICRSIMPDNSAWQGWVTELEVLSMIAQSNEFKVWKINGSPQIWHRDHPIEMFLSESELLTYTHVSKKYFFPSKFNHGCYDAIYIMSPTKMKVIQISQAQTHNCNLRKNFIRFPLLEAEDCPGYNDLINARDGISITTMKVCYQGPDLWISSGLSGKIRRELSDSTTNRKSKRRR
eukprot:gene2924-5738_t